MEKYYVATSWDASGHSPTQAEIDQGIESLTKFPGSHTYNISCWQPHLEDDQDAWPANRLTDRIWHWIEHYCRAKLDYSSMRLANKQVWWLCSPESLVVENDPIMSTYEQIFTRQHLASQVLDPDTIYDTTRDNWDSHSTNTRTAMIRGVLPRVYMQLHCMIDHMYTKLGYFPIVLNKPMMLAKEFNAEFGSYFGHTPVLPLCFSTYYSMPRIVKHNTTQRELVRSANGALTQFKPYQVYEHEPGKKELPNSHWWIDGKLGPALSQEEKEQEYALQRHAFPDTIDDVKFDLTRDLI
jgi:hypothetical protein